MEEIQVGYKVKHKTSPKGDGIVQRISQKPGGITIYFVRWPKCSGWHIAEELVNINNPKHLPVDDLWDYFPVAPTPEAAEIDRRVASESTCDKCGQVGLGYLPFKKDGSYRAFTVCPMCGNAEEF